MTGTDCLHQQGPLTEWGCALFNFWFLRNDWDGFRVDCYDLTTNDFFDWDFNFDMTHTFCGSCEGNISYGYSSQFLFLLRSAFFMTVSHLGQSNSSATMP
jgi:hypothetical protein